MAGKNENYNFNLVDKVIGGVYVILLILTAMQIPRALSGQGLPFLAEDGPAEWMQALFALAAGCVFVAAFWKKMKEKNPWNFTTLAAGLFLLWIFLEEISYGQRIFNFNSPYYFLRHNAHREVNVHNLMYFDSFTEVAIFVMTAIWGVALPVVVHFNHKARRFLMDHYIPFPGIVVGAACLVGIVFEVYFRAVSRQYWANSNEIVEMFLYLGFLEAGLKTLGGLRPVACSR